MRTHDVSWIDTHGICHYRRNQACGTAGGPAEWSDLYDVNEICGHHLASKCLGCSCCLSCDGCYCESVTSGFSW